MGKFIPLCIPHIEGREKEYLADCVESTFVSSTGGEYIEKFEKMFCEYQGCGYSNAVINGTAALHLALVALGIGEGDEVIVPSLTFISTVSVVKYVGAKAVFVDVTEENYTMDPKEVEKAITGKTKAIIPVHLYGNMAEMEEIMKIAEENKLFVIEDATEGLGSSMNGKMAGRFGHIGCFSFNGNKLITTGAGGMICTDDPLLNSRIDYLKNQAKTMLENKGMIHTEIGFNYRMPNLLAAFGAAQFESVHEYVEKKKEINRVYREKLEECKGISFPDVLEGEERSSWLTTVVVKGGEERRDGLIDFLQNEGVISRPFFQPLHKMNPFKGDVVIGDMKHTNRLSQCGVNLPSSIGIELEDVERVCVLIKRYFVNHI